MIGCRLIQSESTGLFSSFFLVMVFTPKSIPFFAAFFPQFLDPDRNTLHAGQSAAAGILTEVGFDRA